MELELLLKEAIDSNLEFEVRFGTLVDSKFVPSVSIESYNNIINNFGNKYETERTIVWHTSDNIRMIYYLADESNKVLKKQIQKKIRLRNITQSDIRYSLSKEDTTSSIGNNIKFNFIRYKNRIRYSIGSFSVDITKVSEEHFELKQNTKEALTKVLSKEPDKYEVEIEYINQKDSKDNKRLEIVDILQELQDLITRTRIAINPSYENQILKNKIYSDINNILMVKEDLSFRRNMVSKVRSLTMKDLGILNSQLYSVTDKADGERLLLYVFKKDGYLINSADEVKHIKLSKEIKQVGLLDGELIDKNFLVFDCLVENGESRVNSLLKERLLSAEKIISNFKSISISVDLKKFEFKNKDDELIFKLNEKVLGNKSRKYNIDGLIFTPILEPYYNNKIYKWKSPKDLTIDFLIRKTRDPNVFSLFVGISMYDFKKNRLKLPENYNKLFSESMIRSNYFPILFSYCPEVRFTNEEILSNDIRDDIIVELRYSENEFKFVKVREDRTKEYKNGNKVYGNSYKVAVENWELINRPVTEKMIIGKEKIPFFAEERRDTSKIAIMKKFHSSIKYNLYLEYASSADWNMELAIGRYADLPKWIKAGIKNIVGFDIDRNALYEGEQLLENIITSKKYKKVPKIYTTDADVSKNLTQKISELNNFFKLKIKDNYFDVISCQFGLHFFLETEDTFQIFVENVKKYLRKGGYFIATTSDGNLVNKLFLENGIKPNESFDIKKDGSTLFSYRRLYKETTDNRLLNTGQEISVYIDSIGSVNKEYLVNLDYVEDTFKKNGLKKIKITYFEKYFNSFPLKEKMSNEEKIFSFLNVVLVFKND